MATSTGLAARTANRGNAENGWKIVAPGVTADGTEPLTRREAADVYKRQIHNWVRLKFYTQIYTQLLR